MRRTGRRRLDLPPAKVAPATDAPGPPRSQAPPRRTPGRQRPAKKKGAARRLVLPSSASRCSAPAAGTATTGGPTAASWSLPTTPMSGADARRRAEGLRLRQDGDGQRERRVKAGDAARRSSRRRLSRSRSRQAEAQIATQQQPVARIGEQIAAGQAQIAQAEAQRSLGQAAVDNAQAEFDAARSSLNGQGRHAGALDDARQRAATRPMRRVARRRGRDAAARANSGGDRGAEDRGRAHADQAAAPATRPQRDLDQHGDPRAL